MTRVPKRALDMLRRFEGKHDGDLSTPDVWEPKADPVGNFTLGYGYCLFEGGQPVRDRETAMRIWRERWPDGFGQREADELLVIVAQDVNDRVLRLMAGVALNENELSALISLAYNIGVGEEGGAPDFADSTVRRRLRAGDRAGAAEAFLMWVRAGGKVIHGLELRRAQERDVFLEPVADLAIPPIPTAVEPRPQNVAPPVIAIPVPAARDFTPPAKSTTVWGAGASGSVALVLAAGPFVLMHLGMSHDEATQTAIALAMLLGSTGAHMTLVGRADANIKPLGKS